MTLFKRRFRIQSARLPGWDYASAAWYFVAVCTGGRKPFLGEVVEGEVELYAVGRIVAEEWARTPEVRANVELDEWVIMPNHVHGIVIIRARPSVETSRRDVSTDTTPSSPRLPRLKPGSPGAIIGQFKSVSTKRLRGAGYSDFAWQPRFYDHVIRGDDSLAEIRQYIRNNPVKWALDKDNPANLHM